MADHKIGWLAKMDPAGEEAKGLFEALKAEEGVNQVRRLITNKLLVIIISCDHHHILIIISLSNKPSTNDQPGPSLHGEVDFYGSGEEVRRADRGTSLRGPRAL